MVWWTGFTGRRARGFEGGSVHVRKSRVLLLVAATALAAALSLSAILVPQQAEATRSSAKRTQLAKRAVYEVQLRRALDGIRAARNEAWRWEAVMSAPRLRYAASAEHSPSLGYRRNVLALWTHRAIQARRAAQHPPRLKDWLCIHHYEGAWNDPNPPYYGGLQMDMSFMQAYGAALLPSKGTADHWTPLEQIWVAERAYRSGRGFYPWPNTARSCGLI
jgi:hypothetical protein